MRAVGVPTPGIDRAAGRRLNSNELQRWNKGSKAIPAETQFLFCVLDIIRCHGLEQEISECANTVVSSAYFVSIVLHITDHCLGIIFLRSRITTSPDS